MTLVRIKATGQYEGDFRAKGIPRLHISLRTKNRKEAQPRHDAIHKLFRQRRTDLIDQLRTGDLTVERLESMVEHHEPLTPVAVARTHSWGTVDACADRYLQWLADHPNRSAGTVTVATTQLRGLRERHGTLDMDAVTPDMILGYQRSLVEAKVPVNTIRSTMIRVGALWRFVRRQEEKLAQRDRRAARPVYSPVEADMMVRDTTRRERHLSEAEIALLLEATPRSARFGVCAGLMAGLRADEMLHLRPVVDVDLELGSLTIREQDGWKPKTKRSRRTVPMAAPLLEVARWHATVNAKGGWMMPSIYTGDRPLTRAGWQRTFKIIVQRAGLVYGNTTPQGVTFHTLRHTFASHAVMRGVDLYTVAQLLGDSLQMVEQTYAHLSPDHKKAAIAKLEAAFKMPQPATQEAE